MAIQNQLYKGMAAGAVFALSLSVMNGLSTYVMKDAETLQEWADGLTGSA
jgi:hypothetical protein